MTKDKSANKYDVAELRAIFSPPIFVYLNHPEMMEELDEWARGELGSSNVDINVASVYFNLMHEIQKGSSKKSNKKKKKGCTE